MMNNIVDNFTEGLNEAQAKAVKNPLDSCTKIVAGAGTGKTKIISKRFAKLVSELIDKGVENPQSKILVITFTDKAANEMKERIVKELEGNAKVFASQNPDISTQAGGEDLWISTFHSFCIRILKKHSIEAGLSPSFKMAEEKQLKEIYDNVIKRIRYGEIHTVKNYEKIAEETGFSRNILEVQKVAKLACVTDLDNLFEDIYSVIKKIKSLGISPREFFEKSRKAIDEYAKTVETIPFKFDSKEEYALNWGEHLKAYSDDSFDFGVSEFDTVAGKKLILDKNNKRKAIEYGMAQGFPEKISDFTKVEQQLNETIAAIFAVYQAQLEDMDVADFDDLINKTIQIFKQNELVRAHYQNYFKQIIVDEFQDTNGAQLELIELLLNPDYPNLTFVGDRKQSIYAFRYAQMENLEVLHEYVEKRYGKKFEPINLSINYRSTPEVLNAVNFVTEQQLNLKDEGLCANPTKEFPDTKKDIKVTVLDGQEYDFDNTYDQKVAEAGYIAKEIAKIKAENNVKYKDFAILVKKHSQADVIEAELKKEGIPSVKQVNTGFFNEAVVKNILSAFRLVKNSEDEQALFRLMKVVLSDAQIYRMKKSLDAELLKTIEKDEFKKMNLAQKFLALSADENLPETPETIEVKKIYETVNYIRKNKSTMPLMQVFEKFKTDLVFAYVKDEFEKVQTENNIKILEKIIDDFTQNGNYISINSLIDYIDKISADRNFELPTVRSDEVDAVQIMTIFASKGLEFPYVFVLSISTSKRNDNSSMIFDMQYGNKPGFGVIISKLKAKNNPKALLYKLLWQAPRAENEALRLFYVAVSRAVKYLNVMSFTPMPKVRPVEYIVELGDYLQG